MEFIEKNSFNVRSTVFYLQKKGEAVEFQLFPMVHIGTKQFFQEVQQKLSSCDVIMIEGIKSFYGKWVNFSYKIATKVNRLGLVAQQDALDLSPFGSKVINTDLPGAEFDRKHSLLPILFRLWLIVMLPIYTFFIYLFSSRDLIADHIAIADLPSREEILNSNEKTDQLDSLLLDERDKNIIKAIMEFQGNNLGQKKTVGILYGAAHMRNITNYLITEQGYKVVNAEYITIFDLI